jgi:drug/metabolite transporter (DMT)-like permease
LLYLFASIFFTSFIYIIFKSFPRFKVDPLPAITVSYVGRVILGFIIEPNSLGRYFTNIPVNLLLLAAATGVTFIVVFSLISRSTREIGVSSTTIISRMSMIIPAGFSVIMYNESLGLYKILGILIAFAAIYFTVYQKKIETVSEPGTTVKYKKSFWLPLFLFLGSGLADLLLKISQKNYMADKADFLYIDMLFMSSAIAGTIALAFNRMPIRQILKKQNILWGMLLGIVNYISLLLFIKALTSGNLDGSQIFPINSVGIVLISTILAIIFLRERLKSNRIAGLVMAVVAILLISAEGFQKSSASNHPAAVNAIKKP